MSESIQLVLFDVIKSSSRTYVTTSDTRGVRHRPDEWSRLTDLPSSLDDPDQEDCQETIELHLVGGKKNPDIYSCRLAMEKQLS